MYGGDGRVLGAFLVVALAVPLVTARASARGSADIREDAIAESDSVAPGGHVKRRDDRGTAMAPVAVGMSAASVAMVQNLDPEETTQPAVRFYRQGSGERTDIGASGAMSPGDVVAFTLADATTHTITGVFSAVVDADREVGTITRTDWIAGRGVAYQNAARAGSLLLVPFVARRWRGMTSFVAIQNVDETASGTAEVRLYESDGGGLAASTTVRLPAGTSRTLGLAAEPAFDRVPNGFRGRMIVESAGTMAVESLLYVDSARTAAGGPAPAVTDRITNVAAFEGLGESSWDRALYVPLVQSTARRSSMVAVMSSGAPGGSSHASVRVTYRGLAGDCRGRTVTHGPVDVPSGGSALFAQGPEGVGLPTGPSGLPADCAASAVVEADRGMLAGATITVTRDADGGVMGVSASSAFAGQDGARDVYVPIYKKAATSSFATTSLAAMNMGAVATTVTITFTDRSGRTIPCGADCTAAIPPLATHTWSPGEIAALPERSYGRAVAHARDPIAIAVVDDCLRVELPCDSASYNGLPRRAAAPHPRFGYEEHVPIFNQAADVSGLPVPWAGVLLPFALRDVASEPRTH